MNLLRTVVSLAVAIAVVLGLRAYSNRDGEPSAVAPAPAPAVLTDPVSPEPADQPPTSHPGNEVVFDRNWLVVEGVWNISDRSIPPIPRVWPGRSNGLLGDDDPRSLWVGSPGLYGKYPVRIERHDARPRVPRRCEDVVEASLRASGKNPVVMGSFDTWSGSLQLDPGSYRVRLCVSNLDAAATEPEFDGQRYHVYSSTYRFQIWPAARRPAEVVRIGSDWARHEHRSVAHDVAGRSG